MKIPNLCAILIAFVLLSETTIAAKTTVNTLTTLTSAFTLARPGDTIIVANGTYNWGKIVLSNSYGTPSGQWIVVMAQTRSGVTFTDSTYIMFSGYRIQIDGFRFANGNSGMNAVVSFRASSSIHAYYSRVSNITFDNYNSIDSVENEWVALFGTNNRVDHCTFINKSNARATVVVWYSTATFPDRSISTYHRIDSNYFKGRSYMGGNGGETIRVGVGNNSRTFGYNLIEYNLFEGCTQTEPEIVSNKTCYNTYRYNTFINCNGGLTLRMGKSCTVYGNFFINNDPTKTGSYGIRIIDKGHKVYNNYCEGLIGSSGSSTSMRCPIIAYNGTYPSSDSLNPLILNGAYLPADSALIANNTIVNCGGGAGIKIGYNDAGMAPNQSLGTTIANNVIKMTSGQAVSIDPTNTSLTYFAEGNMYSAPSGLGISNTSGFANTILTYGARFNGILTPPVILQDAALNTSYYAAIIGNQDAQGQVRSTVFDNGADELNGSGTVINFPLDTNLVGAGKPVIVKRSQQINFSTIPAKTVNATPDFNPGAVATSGLTVIYTISNPAVATIVNGNIHLTGYGSTIITASQPGDAIFNAATAVSQTLTVTGISQTISFAAIPAKLFGDADFSGGASSTSGLSITYASSNSAVATIVNNNIHIVGPGTAVITASQSGSNVYYAATAVSQTLTVNKVYTYAPGSVTILSGSLNTGGFGNLSANDASYYVVNSTTTGTRKIDWYGTVTITQAPSSVSKLTINYDGKNSASKTQVLFLYNWVTAAWVQIDSRAVSTTDVTVSITQTSPASYISSTGQIRLRVYSSSGTTNYTCSGDWLQVQVQSTSNAKMATVDGTSGMLSNKMTHGSLQVFPNPAVDIATINYSLTEKTNTRIVIYDGVGKLMAVAMENKIQEAGMHSEILMLGSLPAGTYHVVLHTNNMNSSIQLIVVNH